MPTFVHVISRKFRSEIANDPSFTGNPTDLTTYLAGGVGERMRANLIIEVSWNAQATSTDTWFATAVSNPDTGIGLVTKLTRSSGNFVLDGFGDGGRVTFVANDGVGPLVSGSANIFSVSESIIFFTTDLGVPPGTYGEEDFTGGTQTQFILLGTEPLTALWFKPNLIENNEEINFVSKIDGTEQSFYIDNIGLGDPRDTSFQIGETAEIFKGWVTGACKARYILPVVATITLQRFEIEYEFTILPYFKRGDEAAVFNLTESQNSITLAFQADFRTVLTDENSSKIVSDNIKKGSVATFGEVFNGQNTQYSITSVEITDPLANVLETLEIGIVNTITVVVASEGGTFLTNDRYMLFHSLLPTPDVYNENKEVFEDVWLYENNLQLIDAAPTSNTILTDIQASLNNPNQFTLTFKVSYSTAQQATLKNTDQFILWIQCEDSSLLTDVSDKTMVEIIKSTYTKNTDVPDLMIVTQHGYFDHPTDYSPGGGFSNIVGCVEDAVLCEYDFDLDLSLGAFIERLAVNFIAFNPITGERFILQENIVDITSQVLNSEGGFDDVQQINIDQERGFNLPTGDQFNFFKMSSSVVAGNFKSYNLQFAIMADWREWLLLGGTADEQKLINNFLTPGETHDGLNKLISNYADLGFELRIDLFAAVSNGSVTTDYSFLSPTVKIFDYDDSDALDWVCTTQTFNPANVDLEGAISTTQFTRFKATFDSPTIAVTDESVYWGQLRIEPQNNPSQQAIEQMSTERGGVKVLFNPLALEIQTKKSIESDNLVLEGLIDPSQLVAGINYKLSARFGLIDSSAPVGGKRKEDGTIKKKEDGVTKFKE